jgi:hypothetical protein
MGVISGLLGGIVLGAIRLSEPFFLSFLKLTLLKYVCCAKNNENKIKEIEMNLDQTQSVITFLVPSINRKVMFRKEE